MGKVAQWSKHLGKINNNKCKCLLILQFSAVPFQTNLHSILILKMKQQAHEKLNVWGTITKYFNGRPQFSSIPLAAICCYQKKWKKIIKVLILIVHVWVISQPLVATAQHIGYSAYDPKNKSFQKYANLKDFSK